MNSRPLNSTESRNLVALNSTGCNSALLFLTKTGLEKSILDATEPVRRLFRENAIHDFDSQKQGPLNKIIKPAIVLTDTDLKETTVSLYRPVTKQGDPRMWFSDFKRHVAPNDVCAIFIHKEKPYLLNLTRSKIAVLLGKEANVPAVHFLRGIEKKSQAVAQELLGKLKDIARSGPLKAVCGGDTAIGRSIETALGIKINSSRIPDYKGIELKSARGGIQNLTTLFACVPDWSLSALKSSKEILDNFGYTRNGTSKLYCTVSTSRINSQGLQLEINPNLLWLHEMYMRKPIKDVCIWQLKRLHERLREKHHETFWVRAKSIKRGKDELFHLESVIHTTKPSAEQFDRLLEDGSITLDHLIKRDLKRGVVEKGPLFRIQKRRLLELFLGEPQNYDLLS